MLGMWILYSIDSYIYRYACAIADKDSIINTGGLDNMKLVERYNLQVGYGKGSFLIWNTVGVRSPPIISCPKCFNLICCTRAMLKTFLRWPREDIAMDVDHTIVVVLWWVYGTRVVQYGGRSPTMETCPPHLQNFDSPPTMTFNPCPQWWYYGACGTMLIVVLS